MPPRRRHPTSPPSAAVPGDPYPPSCSLFFLSFLSFLRRRRNTKRTTPSSDSDSKPPLHKFSFSSLRLATSSFSTQIGSGGSGPVFSGSLPLTRKPIAVKLMDSASLQGEREFHNELFFASKLCSQNVVVAIGSSYERNRRRFLLVYDLMANGNLQDALLRRKIPELMDWKKRFDIIVDIAKGICYLHSCDPPVIHGDIKPSNVLLDDSFSAKISDFGLARLKSETHYDFEIFSGIDYSGSVVEETESVNTGFEEQNYPISETENRERGRKKGEKLKSRSMKDWWRKEDDDEKKKSRKQNKKKGFYSDEEDFNREAKKKKKKKKKNRGRSIDWWFDGISRNSHESFSGEIQNNTPSLKGTVCYVAPEYGHGGEITEGCDVYSFGVLLLVMVSGRRPIEMVNGSPLSEIQKGNLLYWARHCARNGKLEEVIDKRMSMKMGEKEKEEALLCIKVALLCLVKNVSRRPTMEDVVRMISGEMEPPQLPTEYSSSSPSPFPFKSGKNVL